MDYYTLVRNWNDLTMNALLFIDFTNVSTIRAPSRTNFELAVRILLNI